MSGFSFLFELFKIFVNGLISIFYSGEGRGGIVGGIIEMFNIPAYKALFDAHWSEVAGGQKIIVIIGAILLVAVLIGLVILLAFLLKRLFARLFSRETNQDLVDEIAHLRAELKRSNKEKERILKLRVAGKDGMITEDYEQLAAIPGGGNITIQAAPGVGSGDYHQDTMINQDESRFYKLTEVDKFYNDPEYKPHELNDTMTLPEICEKFRNYACSQMRLFYEIRVIRLFWASFATTRIVILQGISGTGKTSLPYATGRWLGKPALIVSVQPSWRDRTEIFGYFNEFTKRFNETETIKRMYEARYTDEVYLTVIDEANIARVEYYFAELLSILEMPSREEWIVDLVPSGWASDPKFVEKGRFKLPENMWYICTINNDDSTFAISDKVYDRAMPINIDSKGMPFEVAPEDVDPNPVFLNYKHIEQMYKECQELYKVSEENIKKFDEMDNYVIEHFRLAFGNRIVKQLKEFVPAYVGCGGTEIDGLDYVLCNKILRKFESLNLAYIRDEVDGYIEYLNEHFGEENMNESKAYLERLKKLF